MIWRINSFTRILHNHWFTGKLLLKDSSQTTKRRFLLLFNTSSSIPDTNLKINKEKNMHLWIFSKTKLIFLKIDHFVHVTEGLNTYKRHIKPQDTSIKLSIGILEEWNGTVIRYIFGKTRWNSLIPIPTLLFNKTERNFFPIKINIFEKVVLFET